MLAGGEYVSTKKKVKTALGILGFMTSLRQTPGPLAVEPLPTELTSLPATIPDLLQARATQADDAVLIAPGGGMTFGEADRESAHLAARLLAAGVGKGARLGVLHPNGCRWLVAWLAAARIGALTVPLSTFAPGPELAGALRHTDVHAVLMAGAFAGESLPARLEAGLPGLAESGPELYLEAAPHLRWVCVDEDTPCWSRQLPGPASATLVAEAEREVVPADQLAVVTTSGATAAPKSVVHTHGSLVRHAAFLAARRGLGPHDRIYSPMPFFWVGGLTMVVLAAYCSGAGAVVQERFEPGEAPDLIERERVTQVSCWPNAARQLAEHPTFPRRDLSAVRGGALFEALPPDLRPSSPDLGPNVLGMTETGGPHTGSDDPYRPLPEDLAAPSVAASQVWSTSSCPARRGSPNLWVKKASSSSEAPSSWTGSTSVSAMRCSHPTGGTRQGISDRSAPTGTFASPAAGTPCIKQRGLQRVAGRGGSGAPRAAPRGRRVRVRGPRW